MPKSHEEALAEAAVLHKEYIEALELLQLIQKAQKVAQHRVNSILLKQLDHASEHPGLVERDIPSEGFEAMKVSMQSDE